MILNNPLNWILPWNEWMNHILNRYLPFLMKSPLFCLFWTLFGHFAYSTSINDSLTIELNYLLNWISRIFFELNNILNWILGKAILNRILNESFFGKIQKLNWIRLGIGHHYCHAYWQADLHHWVLPSQHSLTQIWIYKDRKNICSRSEICICTKKEL